MITRSLRLQQPPRWQTLLSQAITDPEQLLRELKLPQSLLPAALRASSEFKLRVPSGFLARMCQGDPQDPLLRQVLPLGEELRTVPGYSADPLAEQQRMPAAGVLHKYQGRALLTLTGACAVHCRYCFRRHYPYNNANPTREQDKTVDYLRRQADITEVILSGGDPLTLSDSRLADLVSSIETIARVKRLRIHTRLPIVLPERIDRSLLEWMSATRLQIILVVHSNHANELDARVDRAMNQLRLAGVTLLNQSVLLRGVNDRPGILVALSERLLEAEVMPYYLHQLDRVQGAAHFAVSDRDARLLVEDMRRQLPGYLVPRLVREHPDRASKSPL
jgi:EF-P beta-lysylation protein EpmB